MRSFFVFDVESIGLHGEGFAVGGGVFLENGSSQYEFRFSCPPEECVGDAEDRQWVKQNIPVLEVTHRTPELLRDAFWNEWEKAKVRYPDILMAADCLWPVEARFVMRCVEEDSIERKWKGPYPFVEISSLMIAAGMEPLANYDRSASELPTHDPLADSRQSARLMARALATAKGVVP